MFKTLTTVAVLAAGLVVAGPETSAQAQCRSYGGRYSTGYSWYTPRYSYFAPSYTYGNYTSPYYGGYDSRGFGVGYGYYGGHYGRHHVIRRHGGHRSGHHGRHGGHHGGHH